MSTQSTQNASLESPLNLIIYPILIFGPIYTFWSFLWSCHQYAETEHIFLITIGDILFHFFNPIMSGFIEPTIGIGFFVMLIWIFFYWVWTPIGLLLTTSTVGLFIFNAVWVSIKQVYF